MEFIVLGTIPGTHLRLTFQFLVIILVLLVLAVELAVMIKQHLKRRHANKPDDFELMAL